MRDDLALQLGPPPADFLSFLGVRTARRAPDRGGPVSAAVQARLTVEDRDAIERRLTGDVAQAYNAGDDVGRARMLPGAIVLLGLDDVAADARLPTAVPPLDPDAPAAVRLAACGDAEGADVLTDALRLAGVRLDPGTRIAEIDCGHGERMRLLARLLPGLEVTGCNVEPGEAGWVTERLAPLGAYHQADPAKLPFPDDSADVLAGLSPLHRAEAGDATRVLHDACRVLRSGGAFVLAHRGWAAMAHDVATGRLEGGEVSAVLRGLVRSGHHLAQGAGGPRAYLTLEWLMAALDGLMRLEHHQVGRTAQHEDVAVLVRRA
jgi:SAM-dependent methyltransferase